MNIGTLNGLDSVYAGLAPGKKPLVPAADNGARHDLPPAEPVKPAALPNAPDATQNFLAGRISLDMRFAVASKTTAESLNGSTRYRRELSQSFSANYHFDFAFLQKFDGAGDKLSALSPDLLNDFMGTAAGLLSLDEKSVSEFADSVDRLFSVLKSVLGDPAGMMDTAKELFKSTVSDFIGGVRGAMEKMSSQVPSREIDRLQPLDGEPQNVPVSIDFKKLFGESMEKFDNGLFNMLKNMARSAPRLLAEQQKMLAEHLDEMKGAPAKDGNGKGTPLPSLTDKA